MLMSNPGIVFRSAGHGEAAQDAVFRWLKRHIASLPRGKGTFLTEAEVCRATGTSRTPVREALLRLEADGFLEIVPKKGAWVSPVTDDEVEAVMQAREMLEDWCVRRAARHGEALAAELDRILEEQQTLQDSALDFIERDREFHRTIVRAAGNPFLADFYETLRDRQLRMGLQAVAASEARIRAVLAEHRAIVEGLRSADADGAAAAMDRHLATTLAALSAPEWRARN
jgi:DNA-binding GntR family transcriptional regulator